MGYLFDLIILAILGLTIWFGFKKGFIKTVLSALSFFIALVIAFSFQAKLSEKINEIPMIDNVRKTVREEFIKLAPTNNNEQGFDSEKLVNEKPDGFKTILKIAGVDEKDIKATTVSTVADNYSLLLASYKDLASAEKTLQNLSSSLEKDTKIKTIQNSNGTYSVAIYNINTLEDAMSLKTKYNNKFPTA